eukprot:scaffold19699_cov29-Tisochrysis_lutea.AAC.4
MDVVPIGHHPYTSAPEGSADFAMRGPSECSHFPFEKKDVLLELADPRDVVIMLRVNPLLDQASTPSFP